METFWSIYMNKLLTGKEAIGQCAQPTQDHWLMIKDIVVVAIVA